MAYLQVEGERSVYYEHYRGRGRPIVLVHGWGMSCRAWDTTLVALQANGNAVVAFDQRGCGQSDKDFDEVSVATSGSDIVRLADRLGLEGVVLNGWSLGGAVVMDAASKLGARCAGVVLTCGATPRYVQAPDFPHGGPPESVAQTVAALRADRATFLHGLARVVCAKSPGIAVEDWMWSIFMQTSPSADLALAELASVDQREILKRLAVPLLSIVGGKDVFVAPDIGRLAAKMAQRGRVSEYAECGHAPFLEDPARYQRELIEFVNSCG
jgi:pimeloyl-[acyl-carrier protein] methyl ester esterase